MKLPPDLTALQEAVERHDECATRSWREIDRVIVSRGSDINETLATLYRKLDESAAGVGRALYESLDGRYSLNDCLRMCSSSRNGLNARHGLISSTIRAMVDEWRHRDRRFEPRQLCRLPTENLPPTMKIVDG